MITVLVIGLLTVPVSFCQENKIDPELELFDFANGLFARGMYDMAVDGYKQFLREYPESRYAELASFRIAECYFLDGKQDEALNRYGMFLKEYPSGEITDKAALRRGQIYYLKGDYARAEQILSELMARGDNEETKISARYYLAGVRFKQGDYTTSRNLLESILSKTREGEYASFAYINLGDIYAELGDHRKAAELYEKASVSATEGGLAARAAIKAANAYYASGDHARAVSYYEKVIESPAGPDVFDNAVLGLLSALHGDGEYDRGIEYAQKVLPRVKSGDTGAQVMFILGNSYFSSDRFGEAEKIYAEAAEKYPETKFGIKSRLNRCWALYRLGRYKECLSAVGSYVSRTKESNDEALFVKAKAFAGAGDIQQAIKTLKGISGGFPDSPFRKEALYETAWLYADSGQKQNALVLYREFIEQYPKDPRTPSVLLKAAQENLEMGNYDTAEKDYTKFLADYEAHPLKENALFQLGWLYMKQENYDKAAAVYEKFVEEFPDSQAASSAIYWTGKAYQENQEWDKAIRAYSVLVFDKENEFYKTALESLAYTYFQKGDQNKAAEHYYALITMPGSSDLPDGVYKWVADFYLNGGLYDRSIKVLDVLSEKYPDIGTSGEVLYMYGENYSRLKDWDKADEYLTGAIEKKAPSPYLERSYLALGRGCLARGDHEKALGYLEEALKNQKDNRTGALARFEIGNVNFSKMDFEEAAKQYMMVAILYDDEELCPEALFRAGLSFERAGKPEKALDAYKELIRRYPGKAFSREAADNVRRIESENR